MPSFVFLLERVDVEFEVSLQVSTNITSNVRFNDSDFAVSIVVYEEDYELALLRSARLARNGEGVAMSSPPSARGAAHGD